MIAQPLKRHVWFRTSTKVVLHFLLSTTAHTVSHTSGHNCTRQPGCVRVEQCQSRGAAMSDTHTAPTVLPTICFAAVTLRHSIRLNRNMHNDCIVGENCWLKNSNDGRKRHVQMHSYCLAGTHRGIDGHHSPTDTCTVQLATDMNDLNRGSRSYVGKQ